LVPGLTGGKEKNFNGIPAAHFYPLQSRIFPLKSYQQFSVEDIPPAQPGDYLENIYSPSTSLSFTVEDIPLA
jgi:hypothetical protein